MPGNGPAETDDRPKNAQTRGRKPEIKASLDSPVESGHFGSSGALTRIPSHWLDSRAVPRISAATRSDVLVIW